MALVTLKVIFLCSERCSRCDNYTCLSGLSTIEVAIYFQRSVASLTCGGAIPVFNLQASHSLHFATQLSQQTTKKLILNHTTLTT